MRKTRYWLATAAVTALCVTATGCRTLAAGAAGAGMGALIDVSYRHDNDQEIRADARMALAAAGGSVLMMVVSAIANRPPPDIFMAACVMSVRLNDRDHGVSVVKPRFGVDLLRARSVPPYRELYAGPSSDIGMTMTFLDDYPFYERRYPRSVRLPVYRGGREMQSLNVPPPDRIRSFEDDFRLGSPDAVRADCHRSDAADRHMVVVRSEFAPDPFNRRQHLPLSERLALEIPNDVFAILPLHGVGFGLTETEARREAIERMFVDLEIGLYIIDEGPRSRADITVVESRGWVP